MLAVDYKSLRVDDKFCKPFKTYLAEDAVEKFIHNMIEESKYFSEVIKNILVKYLPGAHLTLLEGRGPNVRKEANQYKMKKKRI